MEPAMSTALVIGASRGIGLALSQALAQRSDRVIATCRAPSAALQALDVEIETGVDTRDRASLEALRARLGERRIERLIVNAGVLSRQQLGALDEAAFEQMRQQFEVNALGPLRCVEVLADRLADGARVGLVTSRMGSIADNGSGGHYGYRMSKAALNAAGRSLAHDLAPRGIALVLLHPGYVRTDMTGGHGDVEPAEAAAGLLARLDALEPAGSGSFFHANGQPLPW
jgi:NAD(P)-dependent dehydrogenase (short-subunit alcohol dehydrogenase family)